MKYLLLLLVFLLVSCIPFPHSKYPPIENLSAAYEWQADTVKPRAQDDTIIGYKAGLTSKAGQAKFKVSEPVAGVLFKSGLSTERQVYLLSDYKKLMLETEIGFIMKSDLEHTINNPHQLVKLIDKVVPVIELPDLYYHDLEYLTGNWLIATNVASNKVLIGRGQVLDFSSINQISTKLTRNGKLVIEGEASDAMGDQLLALQWLVNRTIQSGYKIKSGDLLITGALGKMIPAEKGQYDADFGVLGSLAFAIRE